MVLAVVGFVAVQVWEQNGNMARLSTKVEDITSSQMPRAEIQPQLEGLKSEESDHEIRIRKLERFDTRAISPKQLENEQH